MKKSVFALLTLVAVSCSDRQPSSVPVENSSAPIEETPASNTPLIEYTILERTALSNGRERMYILVAPSAKDEELENLLRSLHKENPSWVGIQAYASREHAASGMGQWEALLRTSGGSAPEVSFRSGRNNPPGPAKRFGLSETERKAIYWDIVLAEDRANSQAEREFPRDPGDLSKRFDRYDELAEQFKNELASELGLTRGDLDEIAQEGTLGNWPMPP